MAIQSLIFNRIQRWQDDQPAELIISEHEQNITADHEVLFGQLKKLFQFKAGKLFGQFSDDRAESPFPSWCQEHLEGKIPFQKLATLFSEQFKSQVDKTSDVVDGYLMCVAEERADGPRIYLLLLETSSGLQIDNALSLDTVDHLNLSKLDLALRIDINEWQNTSSGSVENSPYLCMVKGRGKAKIGDAFSLSAGFKNSVDTSKETETLMEILASYTKQDAPKEAADIRQKAYEFCVEQQQLGEAVPLNELSGYLDENQPTRFVEHAEQSAQLSAEKSLRPDTRKLKHLVRISGKGNGLSLSFSSDLMQQTILFDEQNDTLTITSIPKSLKKQILEHLKEHNQ